MGLSCGVICVIVRIAVLIQYRSVTDTHTQTHRHTTTANTALSIASRGKNHQFFLAIRVQRIKTHEHVKFWQNRSIGCTKISTFFNFSKWRAMPSWIFKFVKFHWQTVSGRPRLIIVLNVVKIGRLLWRHFSKWPIIKFFFGVYRATAMLSAVYAVVVCLCVCLSHSGIVSKRLNVGSHK